MSKKDIHTQYIHALNEQLKALAEQFASAGLVEKNINTSDEFIRNEKQTQAATHVSPEFRSGVMAELFEFRNIVNGVYHNLYPEDGSISSVSARFEHLAHDSRIDLNLSEYKKRQLFEALDNIDELIPSAELQGEVEDLLTNASINLPQLGNILLLHFAETITVMTFAGDGPITQWKDTNPSLTLPGKGTPFTSLSFDFKIRKSGPLPDENSMLQAFKFLRSRHPDEKPFVFIVLFTQESQQEFKRVQMRFNSMVEKLPDYSDLFAQIRIVPVSIYNPGDLKSAYEEFLKEFGSYHFHHRFVSHTPPTGFPERNDDIYPTIFEVKKSTFEITIRPDDIPYWRFGLRFSKTRNIPGTQGFRHTQGNVVDIYFGRGRLDSRRVPNPDFRYTLFVEEHGARNFDNSLPADISYRNEPIKVIIEVPGEHDQVIFTLTINDRLIGSRVYMLPEYKYFKLFAWGDGEPFALNVTVGVNRGHQAP